MAFYTTNVLLMIILFLAVILLSMVLYGCKYPSIEKFEDKIMEEGSGVADAGKSLMEAALKSNNPQVKELLKKLQESPASLAVEAESPAVPPKEDTTVARPAEEEKPKLEGKEQELFKAIVRNEISNADLEKLAKAGILTEATIDKFLGQMEGEGEKKSTTIEGFSCGMDYATF